MKIENDEKINRSLSLTKVDSLVVMLSLAKHDNQTDF